MLQQFLKHIVQENIVIVVAVANSRCCRQNHCRQKPSNPTRTHASHVSWKESKYIAIISISMNIYNNQYIIQLLMINHPLLMSTRPLPATQRRLSCFFVAILPRMGIEYSASVYMIFSIMFLSGT